MMKIDLTGRSAIVTGASRGIGLAVTRALVGSGAHVIAGALAGDSIGTLVNNVGAAHPRTGGFLSISDEEWLATLSTNLMSAVRATRSVLPAMLAAGKGAIVSICSVNSTLSDPAVIDYSAAKAALASFSKALSKEVGPSGLIPTWWRSAHGLRATPP
jgi:short-subunit dehydrogenase